MFNLQDQGSPTWRRRAETAVALMQDANIKATRIADLGCGDKNILDILRERLSYDFSYQGYDLIPQHSDVIKIDLNKSFPEQRYDLVFCLGLLEYVFDLDRFFDCLRRITQFGIISYVVSDCKSYTEEDRRAKGWVHNYSSGEIASCFRRNSFDVLGRRVIHNGKTCLFAVRSTEG